MLATTEFMIFITTSFFRLACAGTSASVSSHSRELSVRDGRMVSLSSHLAGHVELYNVFELLHYISFGFNLGFVA